MAEFGEALISDETGVDGVHVEMLDYEYVEGCSDVKQLQSILAVLHSGKEGHYPHLIKTVEDKLLSLLPEKERKKIQRIKQTATPKDIQEAESEIAQWTSGVQKKDEQLKKSAPVSISINTDKLKKHLPPVRGSKSFVSSPQNGITEAKGVAHDSSSTNTKNELTLLLKVYDDLEMKRLTNLETYYPVKEMNAAKLRAKSHRQDIESLIMKSNLLEISAIQRPIIAERERLKGNEFYKAGENEKAFESYTISIALDGLNSITYANRAMVSIRMERLDSAEDDCSRSLLLDPTYIKAWSRRGMTRYKNGRYYEAAMDFNEAIKLDANNNELLALFEKAKSKYEEAEGKEMDLSKLSPLNASKIETVKLNDRKVTAESLWENCQCVADVKSLYLRSARSVQLSSGTAVSYEAIEEDTITQVAMEGSQETFTRVAISMEDDEEDEGVISEKQEEFTRVAISMEDDDEDENDALASDDKGNFTRVSISMEDDENSDEESNIIDVPINKSPLPQSLPVTTPPADNSRSPTESGDELTKWKDLGNGLLNQGKASEAVDAYSKCLSIDPSFIAARSNRAMAYIKLKMYKEAIDDSAVILRQDPKHLKALFRRATALSLEANAFNDKLNDQWKTKMTQARRDLAGILDIDPNNTEALTLLKEITSQIENLSIQWKDLGNEAMKQSQYQTAVDCYSKAIDLDSKNILFYNNRSQAFIKLNQFANAEKDAAFVLTDPGNSADADGQRKKALFRRAIALRGLGDVSYNNDKNCLEFAVEQLKLLLSVDPGNKLAELELQKTEQLIHERSKTKAKSKSGPESKYGSSPSPPTPFDGIDLKPVEVRRKDKPVTSAQPIDADTSTKQPSFPQPNNPSPAESPVKNAEATSTKTTPKSSKSASMTKESTVPAEPPKTEYEFERIWRSLRSRPDLFIKYLETFKSSTFKKILKGSVSSDLLSSILSTLDLHAANMSVLVIRLLEGLSQISSFSMTLAVLPEEDIQTLKQIFSKLESSGVDVASLRGKYNLL